MAEIETIQNKKNPQFRVDKETALRLRQLSEKSGYSIAHIIREISKIYDMVPDNADRIILGIFPRLENRSILFMASPMWVGTVQGIPENASDEEFYKKTGEWVQQKANPDGLNGVTAKEIRSNGKTEK